QVFSVGLSVYSETLKRSQINGSTSAASGELNPPPKNVRLVVPAGWDVQEQAPSGSRTAMRQGLQVNFKVTAAKDAEFTQSYWLKNPRQKDLFVPGKGGTGVEPQAPQPLQAQVELEIAGEKITLQQPVQFRYADKALGEIRREVKIAPAVSVNLNP